MPPKMKTTRIVQSYLLTLKVKTESKGFKVAQSQKPFNDSDCHLRVIWLHSVYYGKGYSNSEGKVSGSTSNKFFTSNWNIRCHIIPFLLQEVKSQNLIMKIYKIYKFTKRIGKNEVWILFCAIPFIGSLEQFLFPFHIFW